ncbi:MAG: hypothetical protein QGM46_11350, partial [Actinomycetota bacterium]|nr:hypothetical protein [Actinomycetota bacterium]
MGDKTHAPLVEADTIRATHWNQDPSLFIRQRAADEIIPKVRRGRTALNRIKSATDHWRRRN